MDDIQELQQQLAQTKQQLAQTQAAQQHLEHQLQQQQALSTLQTPKPQETDGSKPTPEHWCQLMLTCLAASRRPPHLSTTTLRLRSSCNTRKGPLAAPMIQTHIINLASFCKPLHACLSYVGMESACTLVVLYTQHARIPLQLSRSNRCASKHEQRVPIQTPLV